MTELDIRRETALDFPNTDYAMNELILWAQGADAAYRIADRLATTSFVPGPMQRKPGEIAAAILTGKEIGLEPMAALRSINVIQGTPTINAQAMRGLVQSHGHEIWIVESNATRCIVRGRRKGSENIQESVWNMDRAKNLGLVGKDNWKKQPQAMLVARATAEICRWIGSDLLIGVPYATEEMQDEGLPSPVNEIGEVKPAKRTARRAPIQAEVVEADEPELDDTADEAPAVEGITGPQQKKLHALLNEHGLGNREDGLAAISTFLGREITSTKDLTKQDAMVVIDRLEDYGKEPAEPAFDDEGWPPVATEGGA